MVAFGWPVAHLMDQDVVLAEIAVRQLADLEEGAQDDDHVQVEAAHLGQPHVRVLQARGSHLAGADELHDQHVHLEGERLGAADAGRVQARQVAQLLLRPHLHHLPRVALAVAVAESVVARHIPAPSTRAAV